MSFRSFFGGGFLLAGCVAATLVATAFFMSMQFDTGRELLAALAVLGAAALSILLGLTILLFRR